MREPCIFLSYKFQSNINNSYYIFDLTSSTENNGPVRVMHRLNLSARTIPLRFCAIESSSLPSRIIVSLEFDPIEVATVKISVIARANLKDGRI